jgi:hypothetical protein
MQSFSVRNVRINASHFNLMPPSGAAENLLFDFSPKLKYIMHTVEDPGKVCILSYHEMYFFTKECTIRVYSALTDYNVEIYKTKTEIT